MDQLKSPLDSVSGTLWAVLEESCAYLPTNVFLDLEGWKSQLD